MKITLTKKTGGFFNAIFYKRYVQREFNALGKKPSRRKREQTKLALQKFGFCAGTLLGFLLPGPLAVIAAIVLTPFFHVSLKKINKGNLNKMNKEIEKIVCEYIVGILSGVLCSIWLGIAMIYFAMVFPFLAVVTLLATSFIVLLIAFANRNKIKFKSQTNKEAGENMLWGMICALGCEISTQFGYFSFITIFGIITLGEIFGIIFFACMFVYLIKVLRK